VPLQLEPSSSDRAAALFLLQASRSRAVVRQLVKDRRGAEDALPALRRSRELAALKSELARLRAWLAASGERDFPAGLEEIPDAPLVLSLRGTPECLRLPAVAIVGARRASRLGLETARIMARTLAGEGVAVVSGLALGIDAAAHEGALAADGATIAVLGSGLGRVQPVSNTGLARDLLRAGGLLVSEYPLFSPATPYRFPERNRLISGLAGVVVVVEAGERSGSLITARCALEQGREVLAVPGPISRPGSRGVHRLIKEGAGIADSVQDVFDALGSLPPAATPAADLGADARAALAGFSDAVMSVDDLAVASGLAVERLLAGLSELELAGIVERAGAEYIRRPFSPAADSEVS
jgi:DNA processing protein